MNPKARTYRLLLSLALVCVGVYGGYSLADWYRYKGIIAASDKDLQWYIAFAIIGAMLGFVVERAVFHYATRIYNRLNTMDAREKIMFAFGVVLGLVLTALLNSILFKNIVWLNIISAVTLGYVCVSALDSLKDQLRFYFPDPADMKRPTDKPAGKIKLLDTNVIIDGRIADICRAGFVEEPIYVPKFVLEELQQIADSADSLKRARGRRGLEILNQMQKEMDLSVPDFPADDVRAEVDSRLVLVAKDIGASIITNDYNLNKVAGLQGVQVLNINELANALKPVVLPGEEMTVLIVKEGKEKEQGIGYLDDGTMIVVENARKLLGESLDISVTSVLQTVQGKMIFGKMKESQEESFERNSVRSFAGSRQRPKIR